MTQQLLLEAHWEKQVSPQDRIRIEKAFSEVDFSDLEGLHATYIRHDENYKGELLYIVLLHNCSDEEIVFDQRPVTLEDEAGHKIVKTFTLPIGLPPKTSMPWTFIFPDTWHEIEIAYSNLIF